MCGSPSSKFKQSRSTGRAKCSVCGEIFEPDDDGDFGSSAMEPPRPSRRAGGGKARAADRTNGPGIYLIVVGVIGTLIHIFYGIANALQILGGQIPQGGGRPPMQLDNPTGVLIIAGSVTVLMVVFQIIQLLAGLKMRNCESYGLCLTGAILCCIPCCNGTLILAIPGGIWALVVLFDPQVKSAFR